MKKNRLTINLILIFVLAFFAINLCYPTYFNKGVDSLNSKFNLNLPHFWEKPFVLGLDLQGGTHLLYQADLSNIEESGREDAMSGLRDVIERRVNFFGVSEPLVQVQGDRLVVELAGVFDVSEAIDMIGETPFLIFREPKDNYDQILANNQVVYENATGTYEDPFQDTELTGQYLERAELTFDQTTYEPTVSLQFDNEGAELFKEITSRNIGKPVGIYIDNQAISIPTVDETISGGKAVISGTFTVEKAKELVVNLNAGALPVPITLISQQTVGPTLGSISLQQSLKAGIYGLLAVMIFMIIFYRLPGLLASLALAIYAAIFLTIFKLIPVTLTLAGIGGAVLSIGMAVDANVLIFSRFREELKSGKEFREALSEGFRRAWPAIRDGNITTLIVSFILFCLGTSFIKGFALTLSIGVLISMFSALVVTRNFMEIFVGTKLSKIKFLWK
jgi:protein-export membrane protein SecD